MEAKYESPIKVVSGNKDRIYATLSDFTHFGRIMPPDRVRDWQATADTCRFTVDKVGQVGLRIVERDEGNMVKYTADGQTRFNFYLWVQLKEVAPGDSRVRVTLKADINAMMRMLVDKPLQQFVDQLAQAIATAGYGE